jgi:S-adenosylmethionine:tRNA ribosyltransferase-isomerase
MNVNQFFYELPDERIAKYPLENRASSKLLVYQKGVVSHHIFQDLPDLTGFDKQLVFNDTRVIPARIILHKTSGARIEIFLIEPIQPSPLFQLAMQAEGTATWKTMIGNLKKWKEGEVLELSLPSGGYLRATLVNLEERIVSFNWQPEKTLWWEVLEQVGKIPIPPYLNRDTEESDSINYQTVYAKQEGAVAAPTAGLHFTPEILTQFKEGGSGMAHLTLHVSAGTFQPLQAEDYRNHAMHKEQIVISRETINSLINDTRHRIAIGTTALRTLESLYWYGVLLQTNPNASFFIPKLFPYEQKGNKLPDRQEAMIAILEKMNREQLEYISGETEIYIIPGYRVQNADSLLTNFHQPNSTLLVLVEALIGTDWRTVYQTALENEYRFLSYGDSSWLVW